jgi:hypothetical protein
MHRPIKLSSVDELLLSIADHLSDLESCFVLSQRDLKSLALTSHRYYNLAIPEI